jgi:hypothetical protein
MRYIITILITLTTLFSAPAYNAKKICKQADGTEFVCRANGNHHLNWLEDENGEILKYNAKTKNFEYGIIDGVDLKASGVKYQKQNLKKAKAQREVKKIEKQQLQELMQKRKGVRFK